MGTEGADERRVRQLLTARGVSYAPQQPPPPAAGRDRDWLDDILDETRPPAAAPRLPDWRTGQTADLRGPDPDRPDKPTKHAPRPAVDDDQDEDDEDGWDDVPDEPAKPPATGRRGHRPAAQRLHADYLDLPRRTRWVLYSGASAATGYAIGLVPLMEGWIVDCGHDTSPKAAVLLGLGIATAAGILIDHRTRHWWGPLPWLCRIPLASALLALALYAPGVT
jgi:hypothetical protein